MALPPIPFMLSPVSLFPAECILNQPPLPPKLCVPSTVHPHSKQVALLDYPLDTAEHKLRPSPLTPSLIPPIATIPTSWVLTSSKVTKTYGLTSRASLPASTTPWSSASEILYGSQCLQVLRVPILSSSRELCRSSRVWQTPWAQTRASRKRKTPEGDQEYNPEAEVDELALSLSKWPRLETPPAPEMEVTIDPPEVQTCSPISLPGTLFPNHFPSQILPPPPVVLPEFSLYMPWDRRHVGYCQDSDYIKLPQIADSSLLTIADTTDFRLRL